MKKFTVQAGTIFGTDHLYMNTRRLFIFGAFLVLVPCLAPAQSIQLADSLFQTGKSYDQRGKMEQSEFYYREAYNIYRDFNDTTAWLEAGKEYASAMVYRSKNEQAMALYKNLLAVEHPANDAYNRGDLLNSMGWSYRRTGQIDQALRYYQQSLPLALESGDSLLIGVVYNNLGSVNSAEGNYHNALEFLQKSLRYYKKQRYIAVTLNNIGGIYQELAMNDKALEYYSRSLKIREEIGSVHLLATIYNQLGSVQRDLGNYDQALIAYKKSLQFSRQAGSTYREATALNNIGLLYKNLGEYNKALDYYQQSLAIAQETKGPQEIATTTNNLGQLLWARGNKEEAGKYYHRAYRLRQEVGNPYDISVSLNTMLRMAIDNQNYSRATKLANRLKTMGDSTGSYEMLAKASTYRAQIDDARGNGRSALTHYKKANAYSKYLAPTDRLDPLKNLAGQYHKLNSDSAIIYGREAIDLIEKHRSNAGALSEFKSGYFGKHADFYNRVASWALQYSSDVSAAYQLVEQAKARSLSDELVKASQNLGQQLPDTVRVTRHEKRNHINSLYTELERTADAEKRAQLREKIRTAELDYAAWENGLHDKYPELKSLESPEPITLERAQAITDENTAVLEYAVAGDQLMMFLISQDNVHVEQFSVPREQQVARKLSTWVSDFKDAILSNASRSQLRSKSEPLYNALIKPFEKELQHFANLIVVPDGALAYLPFEALSQGDQYLVERFRIKYEPSLTSLTLLKKPKPISRKELLAVAGSDVSNRETIGANFAALPSTLIEVDSIASHFKQVSMLKQDQVSEQAFKDLLRKNRYQYIHLATHGIIDEEHPGRSGLALSTEGEVTASSKEDGMLRSSEIFGMNVDSDMVVLSACNTGLGKVVGGEGMLGMQRAFFYAGTSTVVVSLWNVYDRSTASFMNEFYKALLYSESEEGWTDSVLRWVGWDESIPFGQKATAMHQAKLQMIKHPLFNHPVYWAPFIVVGR